MIIQIRGTSGSGKTWVMRRVMEALGTPTPYHEPTRKNPLYYGFGKGVLVLGHYEATCGGCDNVGSAAAVYDLTKSLLDPDPTRIILQEGLLLSEDSKWGKAALEAGHDLRVVYLSTPLEKCLDQVRKRRREAGNDKPLNEKNTANRVAVIERSRVKLLEAGATCRRAPATQAVRIVLGWIHA